MDYSKQTIMNLTRLGSRHAFGYLMNELSSEHDNLFVLAADVASSANLKDFSKNFPDKFLNMGISEQNMIGTASGLAKEGFNVFAVSFAPFISMRAYEAVRTLAGYMNLSVKIVAMGSGFSMGVQGNTHYGLEDIAIMRAIPNMLVLSPADSVELAKCIEVLLNYNGPAYLRLTGLPGMGNVYKEDFEFNVAKGNALRTGEDVSIIATGFMVSESIRAARLLSKEGISADVIDMHTIKPLDEELLDSLLKERKLIVSVEEHNVIGGLGGAVAEYLSGKSHCPKLLKFGVDDCFPKAGDYSVMLDNCGLSAKKIAEAIISEYGKC